AMTAPLPNTPLDPALEYSMDHKKRGFFIIINQVKFESRTGQKERTGSDLDAAKLEETFKILGFNVLPFRNLKLADLRRLLAEYGQKDHSDNDCFGLAMMSHGEQDIIYCTDGSLKVDELTKPFRADNCASLIGKPKLFFFQACRGFTFDDGVEKTDADLPEDEDLEEERVQRLPIEADNFFFYSTPPGYFSWKNALYGSWFIQELCRVLDQWGTRHEFSQLMVSVQREVASNRHESLTDRAATSRKKQMPVSVSQLTKLLYFRPKLPPQLPRVAPSSES
ncbi:hypothetical protein BOX15_Mlig032540g3, partial [Macrostomum lignano]